MKFTEIRAKVAELANPEIAAVSQRYFKTGPGQYGEGDIFVGIRAPVLRTLAKTYQQTEVKELEKLLESPIHEERVLTLLILIRKLAKADEAMRKRVYQLYLAKTAFINNWDLVDCSAEHIVGRYLLDKSKRPLYSLVRSRSLWERRISIIATFCYIKMGLFDETFKIAEMLLNDDEDLIHKAVGWMLREVGKRHLQTEKVFLRSHYRSMPRTMLRYAIEKFPETERQRYLKGLIN